jgi:hypothetical protein
VTSAAEALLAARASAAANIDYFAEPSSEKLLPDLPPHAASYMRTLGARRGALSFACVCLQSAWQYAAAALRARRVAAARVHALCLSRALACGVRRAAPALTHCRAVSRPFRCASSSSLRAPIPDAAQCLTWTACW